MLAATFYLNRALTRSPTLRLAERGSPAQAVSQFIEQRLPMLILADVGNVVEAREQLTKWIEDGGVIVRFAGPRLAAGDDDLVPVKLRRGGRVLGGSLSWEQPAGGFTRESPFFDMAVPNDVTVTRQVLAEPDATLTERTWATLADGTPLVTAAAPRQGARRAVPRHRRYALVGSAAFGAHSSKCSSKSFPCGWITPPASTAGRNAPREVVPPT